MKSILIVEDDITYGMMLKTWLGKKGFQVASVSSIARAQKHLETEGADLDRKSTRLNSSHPTTSRMPSSA